MFPGFFMPVMHKTDEKRKAYELEKTFIENDILKLYGATETQYAEAERFALALGRVILQERGLYTVITRTGERTACVTGKYAHEAAAPVDYPVAGDWVLLSERGIERLVARKTLVERAAAGREGYSQPIAANMDICLVCVPANDVNMRKIERFLSATKASGAATVVLLTKADLCSDADATADMVRRALPDAQVILCTNSTPDGYGRARGCLGTGVTAALMGASGVGKSTLINALAGTALETGTTGFGGRGRHTTTHRELILMDAGGVLIDTPGMREFALDDADVESAFSDIDALAAGCRFADCAHLCEPGCAVREAVERGELDRKRYESYVKLKTEKERRVKRLEALARNKRNK